MAETKRRAKRTNSLIYIGVVVVILIAAVVILSMGGGSSPAKQTTTTNNLTTMTIAGITTTIVYNLTTATGPNLASCDGYSSSISSSYYRIKGACNWIGGLINVTVFGGSFSGTTLEIVQHNTTSAPFNTSISANACTAGGKVFYMPIGNYNVSFTTGPASGGSCGNATVRLAVA